MSVTQNTQNDAFDFEYWAELHETDAEAFEQQRAALIQAEIDKAPEHLQRRLKGIQFELDAKRSMSDSPLESCMQMTSQMWDSFDHMRTHLNVLARPEALSEDEVVKLQKPTESAKILQFSPAG